MLRRVQLRRSHDKRVADARALRDRANGTLSPRRILVDRSDLRPGTSDADLHRHVIARAAFVSAALTDDRVVEAFGRLGRDLSAEKLLTAIALARAIDLPTFARVAATMADVIARIGAPSWLASDLSEWFWGIVCDGAIGQDRATTIAAPFSPTANAGRAPKGDGDHIRQSARWFYRVHVQQPRDTIA